MMHGQKNIESAVTNLDLSESHRYTDNNKAKLEVKRSLNEPLFFDTIFNQFTS